MTGKAMPYRGGKLTYEMRDNEATCRQCDWEWRYNDLPDRNKGRLAAERHSYTVGHEVVLERVQFFEFFPQNLPPTEPKT